MSKVCPYASLRPSSLFKSAHPKNLEYYRGMHSSYLLNPVLQEHFCEYETIGSTVRQQWHMQALVFL